MHLNELTELLKNLQTGPKKGLSQNFLIDSNIVRKIVQTAGVTSADTVLEVGPGPGALTKELLQTGAKVIAIEMDPIFANALLRLQTPDKRLNVIAGDALEVDFEKLIFTKVVANLPYHITTPLLEKCFDANFSSLTLMIQKEVADRIFAKSGTKEFGSLTLFAQFYANLESKFIVPPSCFYPSPSVDSSVIHLSQKQNSPMYLKEIFFPLMRKAFQQRRKMISTSLQPFTSSENIKKALEKSLLRTDARPEMLSFDEWVCFIQNIRETIQI